MITKVCSYTLRAGLILGLLNLICCFLVKPNTPEFVIVIISFSICAIMCIVSAILLRIRIKKGKDYE